jgi:hypothetical protein
VHHGNPYMWQPSFSRFISTQRTQRFWTDSRLHGSYSETNGFEDGIEANRRGTWMINVCEHEGRKNGDAWKQPSRIKSGRRT